MSQITLVRHGQANTAARDEVSYDQLSELGARQAGWLGAHLGDAGEVFAHSYRGGLHRHRQTADAMGIEGAETDARFDEMEFFTIAHLFEARVCLAIENTSLSRWLPLEGHLALTQFNALPHLEGPDRQFARTHL